MKADKIQNDAEAVVQSLVDVGQAGTKQNTPTSPRPGRNIQETSNEPSVNNESSGL